MGKILRAAGIMENSIVDGPGMRMVVFAQGCPHGCPGCHNPETHDPAGGFNVTVDELVDKIAGNRILDGVTLSGGEPMEQAAVLAEFARQAKLFGGSVWCYTGYTFEQLVKENHPDRMQLLSYVDVLVDGRFVLAQKTLSAPFIGSKNQRILNVPESLRQQKPVLWHE